MRNTSEDYCENSEVTALSLFKSLKTVLPQAQPEALWKDAFKMSQEAKSHHYGAVLSNLEFSGLDNQEMLENANKIYHAGFDIKHLLLFLQAPEISSDGAQTTKDEYLTLWNKDENFKPRISKKEVVERSVIALRGLLVLTGCATILPGVLVGRSIQDPNTVQTGREMASWAFGVVKDVSDAIFTPTVKNIIGSTMTALGGGNDGIIIYRKTKRSSKH